MKTNYKYYLANGACVEYVLSPDISLVETVDRIVGTYWSVSKMAPKEVWMIPQLVSTLNKECSTKFSTYLRNLTNPTGMQVMRLETPYGSVVILAKSDLEIPIFVGSEQELKDNSFNASMEEILAN